MTNDCKDFNTWRIQNLPIPEHPLESTRIDPLRPSQRNLYSSSSGETLISGSSEGANQEHAAKQRAGKQETQYDRQNRQFQNIIEDLHKKIEQMGKEKSEDRRKIGKLEEKIREVEEINSKEVEHRQNIELELEIARQAHESRPPEKKSKDCCKTLLKRKEIEHLSYMI